MTSVDMGRRRPASEEAQLNYQQQRYVTGQIAGKVEIVEVASNPWSVHLTV